MRTKLLIVLLALTASIGTIKAAILNGTCGKNLTWTLNTKTGVLNIEGKGDMSFYPSGDCPWRSYKEEIKNVNLSDGLTSIAGGAFFGCKNLPTVIIPKSVTAIENQAFYGCKSLISIEIPNSVTHIGMWVFAECTSLTSVSLPNGITKIYEGTFYSCSSLKSITIPNRVTRIENRAFSGCTRLTSITIPKGVTFLGCGAFEKCNITSFIVCATTPPSRANDIFTELDRRKCTLYVPASAIETYENTLWWEDFKEIKAIK